MNRFLLIISSEAASAALVAKMLRARQIDARPYTADSNLKEMLENCGGVIVISESRFENSQLNAFLSDKPALFLNGAALSMCEYLGGTIEPIAFPDRVFPEFGACPVFDELESTDCMLRTVASIHLPPHSEEIEKAENHCLGFQLNDRKLYCLQYPIERNDPSAGQLLWNFAVRICKLQDDFTEDTLISRALEKLSVLPSEQEILCTVSGGVDSSVCAVLAGMLPKLRVHCLMINHGFLRQGEEEKIRSVFETQLKIPLEQLDCHDQFYHCLRGLRDSRRKEEAFSDCMTDLLKSYCAERPQIKAVLLGTNLNDRLYSNIVSTSFDSEITVLEPIRDYFKEEIRNIADRLFLPNSIVSRQPFPTNGLALRIWGETTEERLKLLRSADNCFCRKVEECGYSRKLYQYYATLCESPECTGTYAVCLRAVVASQHRGIAARLPYDVLEDVSAEILKTFPQVGRVVYDLSPSAHYVENE